MKSFKIAVPCAVYPMFEKLLDDAKVSDYRVLNAAGEEPETGFGEHWNTRQIYDHFVGDMFELVIEDKVFHETLLFYHFDSDKSKLKIQRALKAAMELS